MSEEDNGFENEPVVKNKNYFRYVWYSGLFLASLFVFLLFTFPYGVVKETIIGDIAQATGLNIRVKDIGPAFPVGVGANGIKVSSQDNLAQVELISADATVSVLSLLIGNVTIHAELVSKNKGVLHASVTYGLFQLIGGSSMVPNSVSLDSKGFELGPIVTLLLREKSKTADELIKATMTQIAFVGNLTGSADIKLSASEPIQSTGTVDLKFEKSSLEFNIPNLNVARQVFDKALVKGTLDKGKLTIDQNSALNSQELKVAFKGVSTLRNPFETSLLDFVIAIKLEGTLKDNFGVFMGFMGGNETGVNYKINGSLSRPNMQGSPN
ncbi:MAG: type II secretion system protein GspN [Chitinophagaceae bacterium]|nr:type II secretion system protein GspN [Oligoflexus sp.]